MPIPTNNRRPARTRMAWAATAVLAAGVMSLGAGFAPASAATTSSNVTVQTLVHPGINNVKSFRITYPDGGSACISFRDGASVPDPITGNSWRNITFRMAPERASVLSFVSDDCRNGTGAAGSQGTIDPRKSDRWTVYAGRAPKVNS